MIRQTLVKKSASVFVAPSAERNALVCLLEERAAGGGHLGYGTAIETLRRFRRPSIAKNAGTASSRMAVVLT